MSVVCTYLSFEYVRLLITACNCNNLGSVNLSCSSNGVCSCKHGFTGNKCNECASGYFGFPACQSCQCDPNGSVNLNCNANGQCSCKADYSGQKCNKHRCAGWKIVNGICYKGFSQQLSWDKARHTCSANGGILVEPRSSSEDDIIATLMRPIVNTGYWIGLNDKNRELRLA